ncbi:anti-sigma factor [Pseudoxanthobacter sp.]|uniref:anti-sigma factor family protein n=1 Tax=Pseudoxanthobacter sp. TaxID=1925742 RepID=UPI002FE33C3B
MSDPISDDDLMAYVDDQLSPVRRTEVEDHLSRHPAMAARVMADLKIRGALRLALGAAPKVQAIATGNAARRLQRGLDGDRLRRRLARAGGIAALVALGWFAHSQSGPMGVTSVVASALPPPFVEDAVRAHRTSEVRQAMPSQPSLAAYDAADIRAATGIVMPQLPRGWRVRDVQVFPSAFGPSVEMSLVADDLGPVSLFAVRPGKFDVVPATVTRHEGLSAAHWQMGEVAYALVAGGAEPTGAQDRHLGEAARMLAASLH